MLFVELLAATRGSHRPCEIDLRHEDLCRGLDLLVQVSTDRTLFFLLAKVFYFR